MSVTSSSHVRPVHLCVLGDLVLDVVVTSGRRVVRGTDVPGTVRFRAGGSAANTARWFARLGGRATFIGALGRDEWGRRLARSLRADGVRVRAMVVDGAATARLAAFVGPDGERSFVTERGAADALSAEAIRDDWLRDVDALHLPAYSLMADPLAGAAAAAAAIVREGGGLVSVDLASSAPLRSLGRRRARATIRAISPDVLFATSDEARVLFKRRRMDAGLVALAPLVVVKRGAKGCRILLRTDHRAPRVLDIPTRAIEPVDSTGAGDAFDAGFLHALLAGGRSRSSTALRRAGRAGNRAATRLLTEPRDELPVG